MAILIVALLYSGCFPYHFTEKPGVSGTVLDARTGIPIPGATVCLTSYPFAVNETKIETSTTQGDGSFLIPAQQRWSLYIVPLDPGPMKGIISVQAKGYKEFVKEFHLNTMGPATTKMKNIPLERLP